MPAPSCALLVAYAIDRDGIVRERKLLAIK